MLTAADPDAVEEQRPGHVDHSTFGARYAVKSFKGVAGQLLAFCIAGHHGRLPDAGPPGEAGTLAFRLDEQKYTRPPQVRPPVEPPLPSLRFPLPMPQTGNELGFALSFFGRMLFSCLIDADRTATEAFCDPDQASARARLKPTLPDLRPVFDAYMREKQLAAPPTPVNDIRRRILADCLVAAELPPGFFSLNVPTGGGKTLASLAFALRHAEKVSTLRRIVVAIPFTSIIEQTADQYRRALKHLADAAIVEHHSNLNPQQDTVRNKLASENWDAPLIVTTNVQLLESLFAARTTPCRKLHRLAHSVIILDEAQTLPVDLLAPTLAALKELVARYGCTVVLCTATQPALEHRPNEFEIGLKNVRPIIGDVNALHASLRRVNVTRVGKLSDDELADRLCDEPQVLCIVNTRAHAAKLYDGVIQRLGGDAGCFHLSTLMCPQHRRDVLRRIRRILRRNKLAAGKGKKVWPCRVVSTQLVEAGVDLDFPCVYRAAAGFDSIAQAAGRCNREGELRDAAGGKTLGRVYVFDAESPPPPGLLRAGAQKASEIAHLYADPLSPHAIEHYFRLYYWDRKGTHSWDAHEVLPLFHYDGADPAHQKLVPFKYATAGERYKIIREELTPVLVPYDETAKKLIAHLIAGRPVDYAFYKASQQYSVGVRTRDLQKLDNNAALLTHPEAGLYYLNNPSAYSSALGLSTNATGLAADFLFG